MRVNKGFTLVELLIVVVLLAIISFIVLAAINPLEQSRRGRDTAFKTFGTDLIKAFDRYFITTGNYPWVAQSTSYNNTTSFGPHWGANRLVGICGNNCNQSGILVTSSEIKRDIRIRGQGIANSAGDGVGIGKEAGNKTPYVCYIPASVKEKSEAIAKNNVWIVRPDSGVQRAKTTTCNSTSANWISLNCYTCLP